MRDLDRGNAGFVMLFPVMLIILAVIAAVQAAPPSVEHHRWTLYAIVMDATTGEVRYQAPAVNPQTKAIIVRDSALDCVTEAFNIGPIPAHDGVAIMLRCVREDGLPLDQKPSLAT